MFIPYDERQELYHHGILGMHWGIRRYQPYPQGAKKGKEVGAATQVKQRPKKRKLSKDAKMRAKMRNEIKNTELRAKLETARAAEAEAKKNAASSGADNVKPTRVDKRVAKANKLAEKYRIEKAKATAEMERDKAVTEAAKASAARREAEHAKYIAKEQEAGRKIAYGSFKTEYGKMKAIRSGNLKKVKRYANMMTAAEYKEALERCDATMNYHVNNVNRLVQTGKKLAEGFKTVGEVAGNAVTMHDNIVDVRNGMKIAKAKKMGHDISDRKILEQLNLGTKWKQNPINYKDKISKMQYHEMRQKFANAYGYDAETEKFRYGKTKNKADRTKYKIKGKKKKDILEPEWTERGSSANGWENGGTVDFTPSDAFTNTYAGLLTTKTKKKRRFRRR